MQLRHNAFVNFTQALSVSLASRVVADNFRGSGYPVLCNCIVFIYINDGKIQSSTDVPILGQTNSSQIRPLFTRVLSGLHI